MAESSSPTAAEEPRTPTSWTRTLASGSAQIFGASLVANAGFFAAVVVLTRSLEPAQRGEVAFIVVTALVAAYLCGLGLSEAVTVFASSHPEARPRLLTNLLIAATLASLVTTAAVVAVLAAAPGVRPHGITTRDVFLLGAGIMVTAFCEAGRAFLLGCSKFRAQSLVQAVWPWCYAALLLAISLMRGLTVTTALIAWVLALGGAAVAMVALAVREGGLGRPDGRLFRDSIHFGMRAWAISVARFMNFRVDQILMGFLATQAALGIYAVAVNASEILLYLSFAVGSAIVPVIGSSAESERGERSLRTLRTLLLSTAAAIAVAAVVGPALIPLVFGSAYQGSVTPFLLLLPGALGFAALSVLGGGMVGAGRPGSASFGFVVAAVVGICLDFALIPWLHATGAAVAASIAFLAGGYASMASFRRTHDVPWRAFVPGGEDLRSVLALARSGTRSRPGRSTT